jgi:hypothetical protein
MGNARLTFGDGDREIRLCHLIQYLCCYEPAQYDATEFMNRRTRIALCHVPTPKTPTMTTGAPTSAISESGQVLHCPISTTLLPTQSNDCLHLISNMHTGVEKSTRRHQVLVGQPARLGPTLIEVPVASNRSLATHLQQLECSKCY